MLDNYTEFDWDNYGGVTMVGYLSDEDLCYLNWDSDKGELKDE